VAVGQVSSPLVQAVRDADVIGVGEQHDNATAHELERRLTASLLAEFPRSTIGMEVLECKEQMGVIMVRLQDQDAQEVDDQVQNRHLNHLVKGDGLRNEQPSASRAVESEANPVAASTTIVMAVSRSTLKVRSSPRKYHGSG
jgi:hypothetical protein